MAGSYRICCLGPEQWETLHEGAHLRIDQRRSKAIAMAEHHFREAQRIRQIRVWGALAVVGFVAASVSFAVSPPWGFGIFVAGLWLLAASAPRCVASITRNLLDPYCARESWESPDWWNH